jgi:hypothetical protein
LDEKSPVFRPIERLLMKSRWEFAAIALVFLSVIVALSSRVSAGDQTVRKPAYKITLDPGHPWRPPFGLERIGRPIQILIEADNRPEPANYFVTDSLQGKEGPSHPVHFSAEAPYSARVTLDRDADEVVFSSDRKPPEKPLELARQAIHIPEFEAEAIARPDVIANPVDLGTILVPSGWLLLGPEVTAKLEAAAISRNQNLPNAQLTARFESVPTAMTSTTIPLQAGVRATALLRLPQVLGARDRDVLSIGIDSGDGHELWHKNIPVMLVREVPHRPSFGASYEKLRFDSPISVRDPATGKYSNLRYDDAWSRSLQDVVVWLPNGSRFVFWRGASYIPFWAGRHNTGACYEWAEIISQPQGAVDCVEPLMDKELRYGRVEIIESTWAQVHVRWRYQSTDFKYQVWGDQAVEDYYFYPDGFGTRVVSLNADPKNDYELSEFIILTPAGAYPLDVLPENTVDALFLDGRKLEFRLPNSPASSQAAKDADTKGVPAIYRLRFAKNDDLAAISFNPNLTRLPPVVFAPFSDAGQIVTPCYWGSHWPLARGNSTGSKIDDRISFTPCHNSVMSWAGTRPEPILSTVVQTLDSLGRSRRMSVRSWVWLIGATSETDAQLRDRARSYTTPPTLELRGAQTDFAGYSLERRAVCLEATSREVQITVKPKVPWVNPVLEFARAPRGLIKVKLAGEPLEVAHFAWDGRTLWLDSTISSPTVLEINFEKTPPYLR